MASIVLRAAAPSDLPRITAIYAHYVDTTPITFDVDAVTTDERVPWFEQHTTGRGHRLLVATDGGTIIGYAGTGQFRAKRAYDSTVEATVYVAHDFIGRGVGTTLYTALFEALQHDDVHRVVAGITIPNDASIALHRRLGFTEVGVFREVGWKLGRYWDVAWFERALP